MRLLAPSALVLGLFLTTATAALAAPPKDLDAYVERAMTTFEAPGMAVAIVEDGQAPVARGYGVRKLGEPARVDAHTVFPIGSNTKAFTATALAILVDEGKLSWSDRVAGRLPGFQMYDPYTTGAMTVTDLLVHRSGLGLGQGDLMIFPRTDFTRAELVAHLRYLQPKTELRAGFAYDNVLYTAAGQMVEALSGQRWEDFVHRRIFDPLGMTDARATYRELKPGDNFGWPHARTDGPIRGMGHIAPLPVIDDIDAAAPAGSINASATDMTKWLAVQLHRGAMPDGKPLFSEAQSRALWTPQTIIPTGEPSGPLAATRPQFASYGLGFFIRDYRGHKIITHDGGVEGGISSVVIIPEKHAAFAIMTNSEEGAAKYAIFTRLLDHYLGLPPTDWITVSRKAQAQSFAEALAALKAKPAVAPGGPPPSLPLASYAGVYRDPWYGTATITTAGEGLRIRFDRSKGMEGALEPVRYNTFRTRWTDRSIEDAYVTFQLKPDGGIDKVTMQAISPLADFSFDYQDLSFTPETRH